MALAEAAAGVIVGVMFLIFAAVALGILAFVFWIWMLVDVAKRDFKKDSEKIVWILVVILTGVIGALIYYFVVKINDKKLSEKKRRR